MRRLLAGLLALPALAGAVDYRVRWHPVPGAETYALYDGDTAALVGTMPTCGPCEPDAPLPCCRAVVSDGTLARAFATAINASGESDRSNVVVVAQGASTTVPTPTSSSTSSSVVATSTTTPTTTRPPSSTTSTTLAPVGGLVAAYAFDETMGTQLLDASGNGRTGALGTATRTAAGKYGAAIALNGTQQATVPGNVIVRTVEAWIFPTATGGWRCPLGNADGGGYWYVCQVGGAVEAGYSRTGSSPWVRTPQSALPLNTWTHVAALYATGGSVTLVLNGQAQVAVANSSGGPPLSSASIKLGRAYTSERFTGRIDELRLYDRVRTLNQIQADLATPIGGSAPPPTSSTSSSSTSTSATTTIPTTSTSSSSTTTTSTSTTTTATIRCDWPAGRMCPAF